jgi:hypothetical protein
MTDDNPEVGMDAPFLITKNNRLKCEIVHTRPELAALRSSYSLIHTCKIAWLKAGLLHFNPGARNRWRQLAFISTMEMGNRHLDSFVLRHLRWTLQ